MTASINETPLSEKMGSFYPITIYSIIIALGGLIFGYDIGTIGGLIESPSFQIKYGDTVINGKPNFNDFTKGSLIGIACLGACSGSLISKVIINKIGLKKSFFIACCIYISGNIVMLISPMWYYILIGRFIIGNGNGLICTICPMFISDLSPIKERGIYVSFQQLFTTLGILVGGLTMYYSATQYSNFDLNQFRYSIYQAGVISIISSGLIWIVPESPIWLIKNNDLTGASLSISKIKYLPINDESVDASVLNVCTQSRQNESNEKGNKKNGSIRHGEPKYLKRTLTGIALFGFQQFTGINYFFFYGTSIFSKADLNSPYLVPVILGSVNLIFSILSIFTISRFNRKTLLIFGSFNMMVLMIIFASIGITIKDKIEGTIILIISACGFIGSFAMTWGPISQVLISELYPNSIKVKAMSIACSMNWVFNFTISMFVPIISNYIGFGLGYIFVGFLMISIGFVYYIIPETRNKSIEQINMIYENPIREEEEGRIV